MRTICCLCKRVKGENGWVQVDGLVASRLSHGYCPECYEAAMRMFREKLCPLRRRPAPYFRIFQK